MLPELSLTAKHYARLRKYWHAGSTGLTSAGDGLALSLTAAGYLEMKSYGGGLVLLITARASRSHKPSWNGGRPGAARTMTWPHASQVGFGNKAA